jgi:hypothetical protein
MKKPQLNIKFNHKEKYYWKAIGIPYEKRVEIHVKMEKLFKKEQKKIGKKTINGAKFLEIILNNFRDEELIYLLHEQGVNVYLNTKPTFHVVFMS